MRSKASLILMEQLIMVLVFAAAAALCLQVFAGADAIAKETSLRDEAVLMAQNAAEQMKAGEIPEASENPALSLEIRELPTEIPGLVQAEILVLYQEGVLFSLTTGWQEVAG